LPCNATKFGSLGFNLAVCLAPHYKDSLEVSVSII